MYKYIPLSIKDNYFIVKDNVDYTYPWGDEEFVNDFEKILSKYFSTVTGDVSIGGAEFKSCTIYKPEKIQDDYYIKVSKNNIPYEIDSSIQDYKGNTEGLEKIKSLVNKSEFYYEANAVSLEGNYLIPCLKSTSNEIIHFLDEKVLLNYPRILITGAAGSGKTTLVRKLVYELLGKLNDEIDVDHILPFYFQLRQFNIAKTDFIKIVNSQWNLLSESNLFEEKRKRGKLLLVFDGADELNLSVKKYFFSWLDEITAVSSFRIIITSRSKEDINNQSFIDYAHFQLMPLYKSQIYELTYRLLKNKSKADYFFNTLTYNDELLSILSNPLALSFSIALFHYKNVLPSNQVKIIKDLTYLFTESWDENRLIKRYKLLNPISCRFLLGKLAYRLMVDTKFTFKPIYLKEILGNSYPESYYVLILNEIKNTTGLLFLSNEEWSFTHKAFMEYFCASYLLKKSDSIENDFSKFRNNNNWLNVWNNTIKITSDPEFYFNLQKQNKSSAFFNLSRLVTVLTRKDQLSFNEYDIEKVFIKACLDLDKYIEQINIKRYVFIEIKTNADFKAVNFAKLLIQIWFLKKERIIKQTWLNKSNCNLVLFIRKLVNFSNMPNYQCEMNKISFSNRSKIKSINTFQFDIKETNEVNSLIN